jgi:hypothetical protein
MLSACRTACRWWYLALLGLALLIDPCSAIAQAQPRNRFLGKRVLVLHAGSPSSPIALDAARAIASALRACARLEDQLYALLPSRPSA